MPLIIVGGKNQLLYQHFEVIVIKYFECVSNIWCTRLQRDTFSTLT